MKPYNRKGPDGHSETHCHSADLERKTSELLIGLKRQTHQENQSPSAGSELKWKTHFSISKTAGNKL